VAKPDPSQQIQAAQAAAAPGKELILIILVVQELAVKDLAAEIQFGIVVVVQVAVAPAVLENQMIHFTVETVV
jgi:hypothetical protein